MIKAVIFDLDGTLVDTMDDLCDSTNYVLQKHGFPIHEKEKYNYFIGDGVPKLIERALPEDKRSEDMIKTLYNEFMVYYRVHFMDKSAPYENIPQCLNDLLDAGYKLAVVSNKVDEMTVKIVNKLFDGKFLAVTGKRENYPVKPDPALTLEIMKQLGVKPSECVFIGDSGMDIATAKNAGCLSIGVTWGFRLREELQNNNADYIVTDPNEILKVVKGI